MTYREYLLHGHLVILLAIILISKVGWVSVSHSGL